MALFCEEKPDPLRRFLASENGAASPKTFWRVFELIGSQAFAACVAACIGSLAGTVKGIAALDGKSNEITDIPELLKSLAFEGAIITAGAMGPQKAIAQAISNEKADCVCALKGNQSGICEDVHLFLAGQESAKTCDACAATVTWHGRIEEHTSRAKQDIACLKERHPDWRGLRSIALSPRPGPVKKRKSGDGKPLRHIVAALKACELLAVARALEHRNDLPCMLGAVCGEDLCLAAKRNAALNLGAVRKAAPGLLKCQPARMPVKRKIKKACCNNDVLAAILC
jgi:predicted transposase YbfD/YdcC